jgi:hypothetical protein
MATRHDVAVSCMDPNVTIRDLAYALVSVIEECHDEQCEAHTDVAAVLLVARLAFMTNTEMLPPERLNGLIQLCKDGVHASIVPAPSSIS